MANDKFEQPVVTDDMTAGIMAAFKRIESVPAAPNLIDTMDEVDWQSDEADDWNINAGSTNGVDEIDNIDEPAAA